MPTVLCRRPPNGHCQAGLLVCALIPELWQYWHCNRFGGDSGKKPARSKDSIEEEECEKAQ